LLCHQTERSAFIITIFSFAAALGFFAAEFSVYQTCTVRNFMPMLIIASMFCDDCWFDY